VVPNQRYRLEQYVVPVDQSLVTFDERIKDQPHVQMVYARMSILPDRLFDEVIFNVLIHEPDGEIPPLIQPGMAKLRRSVFRGSADSDYGKELRWSAETKLQPWLTGKIFSRNQLLNEGVEVFQNRAVDSTDILHEYFVPRERVVEFVTAMRQIVLKHRPNLLNVTVRAVNEDTDTFLRYADQSMLAFVLLLVQHKDNVGESSMNALTQELIEAALGYDGRYYLPYRLHASRDQFHRAYPQAREFFDLKRKYDPDELFQNTFYATYGQPDVPAK
jgi:FAD/FMN-containing dehydrogenase